MAIGHAPEPLHEDEERLGEILSDAELPSLLPALPR